MRCDSVNRKDPHEQRQELINQRQEDQKENMAIDRFAVREVLFGDINDKQYGALLKSERLSLASAPQQFQDKYESGH